LKLEINQGRNFFKQLHFIHQNLSLTNPSDESDEAILTCNQIQCVDGTDYICSISYDTNGIIHKKQPISINSNLSIYKYYTFKDLRNQHHISYENICKLFNTIYLIHWELKHSVNNSLLNNNTLEVEIRKEQAYHHEKCKNVEFLLNRFDLNFLCLTPLSAIFKLYHGDQV
jgi:hypothetical protein